ncbi:MAG: hypothetical protein LBV26_05220 [Bacteroidales bacterium]|jgi:hypothetical protein|nr:hypothetical protein [Bacteroidales bacterium]
MKKYLLLFFLLSFLKNACAQEIGLAESIMLIAEELSANESDPEAAGNYIEMLYELYENPVSLNTADEDEMLRLFFLSDFQVKVLHEHVRLSGKIVSLYEIAALPGFNRDVATMMGIFITLDDNNAAGQNSRGRWRNRILTNVIFKDGETDTAWLGPPSRVLTKYRFSSGGFSGGITAEKDPGESFLNGSPPMPDMFSGHLAWDGEGTVKKIIVGDFSARFGQGIVLNTGIAHGLSLHSPGLMVSRSLVKPYTSTDENSFFRGVATEISFKNVSLSLLYSDNNIDATVNFGANGNESSVQSFYTSGLHNTRTAMKKKDVLNDRVYAANVTYSFKNTKAGALWSYETLSAPFVPETGNAEKAFSFKGALNSAGAVYYNSFIGRILLFGEISVNEALKIAAVQGLTARLSDRLAVNLLFRGYEKGFNAIHGKGPGGASLPGTTMFGNFTFEAARHLFVSGGCEITDYGWLRYNISSPSYKTRRELRVKYTPFGRFSAETSYNCSVTTSDGEEENRIPELIELTARNLNTVFRYSITDRLSLGTKFYFRFVEEASETGMLLAQDLNYHVSGLPLIFWLRFSVFNTEGWDSRIYVYENDLIYSYSVPAFSGEGSKNYMMISWKIRNRAELRFRYAIMSRLSGTGADNISDFRLQISISI